jgi:hypothetical protein
MTTTCQTTTCQICGRAIKAKDGRIAHHGYTRPQGYGYQTRSCFGARYRSYEVAHDALDRYIPMLEEWRAKTTELLAKMASEPPATMIWRRGSFKTVEISYDRPAGFEPMKWIDRGYRPDTYEGQFASRCSNLRREIFSIDADIAECRSRVAAWKEPK